MSRDFEAHRFDSTPERFCYTINKHESNFIFSHHTATNTRNSQHVCENENKTLLKQQLHISRQQCAIKFNLKTTKLNKLINDFKNSNNGLMDLPWERRPSGPFGRPIN